jgi:hypothetical protein
MPTIRAIALSAFAAYLAWNASWLFHGHVPPSILAYYSGLPCPTTGMTRSVISLWRGDIRNSLLFNPFTVVYLVLTGLSAYILLAQALRRRDVVLPKGFGWAWLIALGCGWVTKFALGHQYW